MRAVKYLYHVIDVNLTRNQKLVLARFFPGIRSKVESTVLLGDIDWSMTKVYAAESRNELRINLKGREPLGSVAPGQESVKCDEQPARADGVPNGIPRYLGAEGRKNKKIINYGSFIYI